MTERSRLENQFWASFLPPLFFIAFLWLIQGVQVFTKLDWGYWGIYPRESFGLRGIFFAPILHADWGHLISNSVPFLVTATMITYFYPRVALRVFFVTYFLAGFSVWIFARTGVFHIGLSYMVYALVSFVFWTGIFRRSIRSVILALIVLTLYSGMISGILPTTDILRKNISWDSHLIGAIVGVFVAYFYMEELEDDEIEAADAPEEKQALFFTPSVFDKTLAQREAERLAELEEQARLVAEDRERRKQEWLNQQNDWSSNSTL